jgi:hypothetical protein
MISYFAVVPFVDTKADTLGVTLRSPSVTAGTPTAWRTRRKFAIWFALQNSLHDCRKFWSRFPCACATSQMHFDAIRPFSVKAMALTNKRPGPCVKWSGSPFFWPVSPTKSSPKDREGRRRECSSNWAPRARSQPIVTQETQHCVARIALS